jgi:hypothetical protein
MSLPGCQKYVLGSKMLSGDVARPRMALSFKSGYWAVWYRGYRKVSPTGIKNRIARRETNVRQPGPAQKPLQMEQGADLSRFPWPCWRRRGPLACLGDPGAYLPGTYLLDAAQTSVAGSWKSSRRPLDRHLHLNTNGRGRLHAQAGQYRMPS